MKWNIGALNAQNNLYTENYQNYYTIGWVSPPSGTISADIYMESEYVRKYAKDKIVRCKYCNRIQKIENEVCDGCGAPP